MRVGTVLLALLTFLALWIFCITIHWGEIAAMTGARTSLATRASSSPKPYPPSESLSLTAALANDKLVLSGAIPSNETKAQLLDEAKRLFGESNVLDKLSVRPNGSPAPLGWLPGALAVLPLAKTVGFALGERRAVFQGYVPTEKMKSSTLALARTTLGDGWTVVDSVQVGTPPPAGRAVGTFSARRVSDIVILHGTLPSAEARLQLQDAARVRFGENGFTQSLEVADKPAPADPEWIETVEKAIAWGSIAPIEIQGRTLTLRGTLLSEAEKSERLRYVRKTLGPAWTVVDQMAVRP